MSVFKQFCRNRTVAKEQNPPPQRPDEAPMTSLPLLSWHNQLPVTEAHRSTLHSLVWVQEINFNDTLYIWAIIPHAIIIKNFFVACFLRSQVLLYLSLMMLMVFRPSAAAIWITACPTALLAAFWITVQPTQPTDLNKSLKTSCSFCKIDYKYTKPHMSFHTRGECLEVVQHPVGSAGVHEDSGGPQKRDVFRNRYELILFTHSSCPPCAWHTQNGGDQVSQECEANEHSWPSTVPTWELALVLGPSFELLETGGFVCTPP